jgi:hypothetical protein
MSVTIGSLYGDDQRLLEDLDLLPQWESSEGSTPETSDTITAAQASNSSMSALSIPSGKPGSDIARTYRHGTTGGIPWFEEMIEGSGLGRLMKTRGGVEVSGDQSTTIEWEVSEWTDTGTGTKGSSARAVGKRKRGDHT